MGENSATEIVAEDEKVEDDNMQSFSSPPKIVGLLQKQDTTNTSNQNKKTITSTTTSTSSSSTGKKLKKNNKRNMRKKIAKKFSNFQNQLDKILVEKFDDFVKIEKEDSLFDIDEFDFCDTEEKTREEEPSSPKFVLSLDLIKNQKFKLKDTKTIREDRDKKKARAHSSCPALLQIFERRQYFALEPEEDEESVGLS